MRQVNAQCVICFWDQPMWSSEDPSNYLLIFCKLSRSYLDLEESLLNILMMMVVSFTFIWIVGLCVLFAYRTIGATISSRKNDS